MQGVTAVVLPGTGSDDDYIRRAFALPLGLVGAELVTHRPRPERLIEGYLAALDAAAERVGSIIVGGVSIGASVAAAWALQHPQKVLGVLAALPAWSGAPDAAPAALAARYSAEQLRRDGLAVVVAGLRASSPPWLAAELTRSWTAQWPHLPDALEQASTYVAPTCAQLAELAVPMGVSAATDDPVHPVQTASEWVAATPRAALRTVSLDQMGADPSVLGIACVSALITAGAQRR